MGELEKLVSLIITGSAVKVNGIVHIANKVYFATVYKVVSIIRIDLKEAKE